MRRKIARIALVFCIAAGLVGCFEDTRGVYFVENQSDLINPNGIYRHLLNQGIENALQKIDLSRYRGKVVHYNVEEITDGVSENMLKAHLDAKLSALNTKGVSAATNDKGQKVPDVDSADFQLSFKVPVSGIHEYQGFVKNVISSYVLVTLLAKTKDGGTEIYSSGVVETKLDKFIPSRFFIAAMWTLIVGLILLGAIRNYQGKREHKRN